MISLVPLDISFTYTFSVSQSLSLNTSFLPLTNNAQGSWVLPALSPFHLWRKLIELANLEALFFQETFHKE